MNKILNEYKSTKLATNKHKRHSIHRSCVVSALTMPLLLGLPAWVYAQSTVGTFSSVVTIQGPVNQTATGSNVQQNLTLVRLKSPRPILSAAWSPPGPSRKRGRTVRSSSSM